MSSSISPTDLSFFSTLVATGSLGAAARELSVTTAAVSKRLALMEQRLALKLVNRNTRRMSLTPEGEIYLARARRILSEIEDMEHALSGGAVSPRGLIRVNATLGFGRAHISPLLSEFTRKHPQVEIQLQLTADPPPISDDLWDLCFRFGAPPDSRAIAKFLASNQRILCASPKYLRERGEPKAPMELVKHNCITIRQGPEAYGLWRFTHQKLKDHQPEAVKVRGNLTTNDGEIAVNWALEGRGIVMRAQWDVERHLINGNLKQVLENYRTPDADIYAVYPSQHKQTTRVKALVDFASKELSK